MGLYVLRNHVSITNFCIRLMLISVTVHAKDAPSEFSLKRIKDLPNIQSELEVDVPALVTFTISWYEWKASDDPEAPETPTSPSKKKKEGYTKAVSFNIHDIVRLSSSPATGDDISYNVDSEDDVFL